MILCDFIVCEDCIQFSQVFYGFVVGNCIFLPGLLNNSSLSVNIREAPGLKSVLTFLVANVAWLPI